MHPLKFWEKGHDKFRNNFLGCNLENGLWVEWDVITLNPGGPGLWDRNVKKNKIV